MLFERIAAFVRGDSDESFGSLALDVYRCRYERDGSFRELCDRCGSKPESVTDWRRIPVVEVASLPTSASSGDEADAAGDALHRAVIDRSLPAACLGGLGRPPVLTLIPSGDEAPDPGLASLSERVLDAWAAPDSVAGHAGQRLQVATARGFLAARQRDGRPLLILATPGTLSQLLEALERRGLRFRLPPGSRVAAYGGAEPVGRDLPARLAEGLAVPPEGLVRVYGVPGLRSRFYAAHGLRGEPRPFRPPVWARVRVLDPEDGTEAPPSTAGSLAIFDLASPEAGGHVDTGSAAMAGEDGFRLVEP